MSLDFSICSFRALPWGYSWKTRVSYSDERTQHYLFGWAWLQVQFGYNL